VFNVDFSYTGKVGRSAWCNTAAWFVRGNVACNLVSRETVYIYSLCTIMLRKAGFIVIDW